MDKRSRVISNEDGAVEISGIKYNGKYIFGNLLVCGDCGASYRRRTERNKVVWCCTTRIEQGKNACPHSPTLDEAWVQDTLSEAVCQNGVYNESIIRNKVDKIQVYDTFILIFRVDGSQEKKSFQNGRPMIY
ncbi:MAG: zinc ribbon domain-containing protein [Oscillospiraceae bacterium]|nr:zinc ribbon domain-containing protein [Oscillospiraceae bacterium]